MSEARVHRVAVWALRFLEENPLRLGHFFAVVLGDRIEAAESQAAASARAERLHVSLYGALEMFR